MIDLPPEWKSDPRWFDFSNIDRDTLKWHLRNSCSVVATLTEMYAEALYNEKELDRLASLREKKLFLLYKGRPHPRISRDNERVWEDGSDLYAGAASRADDEANRLRALELKWMRRRVDLRGCLDNFEKKSVYLATLGGVLRGELEMENR